MVSLEQLTKNFGSASMAVPALRGVTLGIGTGTFTAVMGPSNLTVNLFLVGLIVLFTALTLVNTLAANTIGRRGEYRLQRLSGYTPRQIRRMVTVEGGLITVTGVGLGGLAPLLAVVPFRIARIGSLLPTWPLWVLGADAGVALVLTLGASLLPGRRAQTLASSGSAASADGV